MPSRARVWIVAGLALGGCLMAEEHARNTPPVSSLRAPVIAPAGYAVVVDASASLDPEGDALTFVFDFGDGAGPVRSAEATLSHVFNDEGLYSVSVRVIDASGAESVATQDIAVRLDFPDPPDFCETSSDCVVGDECTAGICYSVGGAVD